MALGLSLDFVLIFGPYHFAVKVEVVLAPHPSLVRQRGGGIDTSRCSPDDDTLLVSLDGISLPDFVGPLGARVVSPKFLSVVQIEGGEVALVDGNEEEVAIGTEPCGEHMGVAGGGDVDLLLPVGHDIEAEHTVVFKIVDAVPVVVGVLGNDLGIGRQ